MQEACRIPQCKTIHPTCKIGLEFFKSVESRMGKVYMYPSPMKFILQELSRHHVMERQPRRHPAPLWCAEAFSKELLLFFKLLGFQLTQLILSLVL